MKLYNTLSRKNEDFVPIDANEVRVYTCGPTVYSKQHIGNYTSYIYWDLLVRALQLDGFKVERVLNLTDVGHLVSDADDGEDKMEKGARAEGLTAWQVAEKWGADFLDNFRKLNLVEPSQIIKATDYVNEGLELIRTLKAKGYTYQIDDGIYYDTSKFPQYADFAHLDIKALKAGARVEHNKQKRNITDFALWKFSPKSLKRDMEWSTPPDLLDDDQPRMGFPGWHLECSAIIKNELGDTIDVHTGGIDHIPIHHTNEIAQSEAANGAKLANYWLHCHFITVDGQKISKSLGNIYTFDDILAHGFSHMDFKMWVLQGHFQSDRDFTFQGLESAKNRLAAWRAVAELRWQVADINDDAQQQIVKNLLKQAADALLDNINTPEALKYIDQAIDVTIKDLKNVSHEALKLIFYFSEKYLGLDIYNETPNLPEDLRELIIVRETERANDNYEAADKIRDALLSQNVFLNDTPVGVIWSK
jgi:cysteinyl-tRNA synthetase